MDTSAIPETGTVLLPTHGERQVPQWATNPALDEIPPSNIDGSISKHISRLVGYITAKKPEYTHIDNYVDNKHVKPYVSSNNGEHEDRLKRSITNFMPLVIQTIQQELYVDGFGISDEVDINEEAWDAWQEMQMDYLQRPLYEGGIRYGVAYLECRKVTDPWRGDSIKAVIHSPRNAAGVFVDRHDVSPAYLVVLDDIESSYSETESDKSCLSGRAWDDEYAYEFELDQKAKSGEASVTIKSRTSHNCRTVPAVRIQYQPDINGKVTGAIKPLIPQQDKINQIWFDLLSAQASSAHATKWIAGIKETVRKQPVFDRMGTVVDWKEVLDGDGRMIKEPIEAGPGAILTVENPDTKFGSFVATDLGGYHNSIEMAVQNLSSTAQIPPHNVLGQIANLSAEALDAARDSLNALITETKSSFGESLETFMLIALEVKGTPLESEASSRLECRWREMNSRNINNAADGIIKMAEYCQLSPDSVLEMFPNTTQTEIERWKIQREEFQEESLSQQIELMQEEQKVSDSGVKAQLGAASSNGKQASGGLRPSNNKPTSPR